MIRLPRARVVLVGCAKTKVAEAAPAKELYRSPLFTKARAWAEREVAEGRAARWGILSVEYALLDPDRVVEPYELTIRKLDPELKWAWASRVDVTIRCQWGFWPRPAVVLAGGDYIKPLERLDWMEGAELPLDGLQVGQRLQWLNRELADPIPLGTERG